ncbi:MAG: hypothetical protein ACLPXZ_20415 [Mycobacterium sp.]
MLTEVAHPLLGLSRAGAVPAGFGRPWNRLEQLTEGVIGVREVALGSGCHITGRAPWTRSQRKSRSWPMLPGGFRVC